MKKKALTNGLIFLALTILLLYCLDLLNGTIIKKDNFNKVWWMAKIKKHEYDYAFIGDSRVYTMVETQKLDSAWHKKGIDLALDGSNIMEQYLILKKFIQGGNTIKDLFIGFDYFNVSDKCKSNFRIWCFLPFIQQDDFVYVEIKRTFGATESFCWKYIPYYKYAEFNSKLGLFVVLNSIGKFIKRPFDDNGNFISNDFNKMDTSKSTKFVLAQTYPVDTIHFYYLEKIGRLCEENHIKMHVFTPPVYYQRLKKVANADTILKDHLYPSLQKVNSDFHSFCDMPVSNSLMFFSDPLHLNKIGIPYLTSAISAYYKPIMTKN